MPRALDTKAKQKDSPRTSARYTRRLDWASLHGHRQAEPEPADYIDCSQALQEGIMESKQPYHIMAAVTVALALSFAAGALSASVYPAPAEAATIGSISVGFINTTPVQYFPHQYQNQATEIEEASPTF
jgi:hypothetical protein